MKQERLDKAQPIPLHRVAVVRPFAKFLADVGAPVEREFRQAGMPFSALENVDNYVPSHRFWSFLTSAARSQGIESLGFHVGHKFGADCADPQLTRLLRRSPTLYQGLVKASELTNKTITHCRLGLIQPPGSRHVCFYHRPSCNAQNSAIDHIGWFGLMVLIGMVQVFAGPKWRPAEIGVMTDQTPYNCIQEQFPITKLRMSQRFSYITVERALLGQLPLTQEAAAPASLPLQYDLLPNDFIGSLTKVLVSYIQEHNLSLEVVAEMCNRSKRSLQRTLREEGSSYAELLKQARFQAASRMMQDPDKTVSDVSHLLGYSDPTHFSRAFRRVAGVSPREYRQVFIH